MYRTSGASATSVTHWEILDRGFGDAYRRSELKNENASQSLDIGASGRIAISLRRSLRMARRETSAPGKPSFVPFSKLMEIISLENTRKLLDQLPGCIEMTNMQKMNLASTICFGTPGSRYSCRRLVATLIDEEREDDILAVIDHSLRDDCLLNQTLTAQSTLQDTTWSELACKLFRILGIEDQREKTAFNLSANKFTAPYFTRPESGVHHYILDLSTVLPFTEQLQPASGPKIADNPNIVDGYGTTRRTRIHPDHFHFSDYGPSSNPSFFAIKELASSRHDDFVKEASALLPFSHKNDKQLVKLLATYEIREGNTRTFYLIFPWADGSIRSLWRAHPKEYENPRTEYLLGWISNQALAIANSLAYLHEEYAENVDAHDKEKYGRHGDIKASNFLVYPDSNVSKGRLIFLADFGLARFHRQRTRSIEPVKATSPSYRPPEFDTTSGTLSRKSDIWSLGAFFLEFLTWYLRGWQGVSSEFPDFREEIDYQGIKSDIFFTIINNNGQKTAIVKDKIYKWIAQLHRKREASEFVHDMLDLVQAKMLVVDPQKRITAVELTQVLLDINKKCRVKKGYLTPGSRDKPGGPGRWYASVLARFAERNSRPVEVKQDLLKGQPSGVDVKKVETLDQGWEDMEDLEDKEDDIRAKNPVEADARFQPIATPVRSSRAYEKMVEGPTDLMHEETTEKLVNLASPSFQSQATECAERLLRDKRCESDVEQCDAMRSRMFAIISELHYSRPEGLFVDDRGQLTQFERFQFKLEALTGEEWNWWPLRRPRPELRPGESRLGWTCSCGNARWEAVPEEFAQHLALLAVEFSLVHTSPLLVPPPPTWSPTETTALTRKGSASGAPTAPPNPWNRGANLGTGNINNPLSSAHQTSGQGPRTIRPARFIFLVTKFGRYALDELPSLHLDTANFGSELRSAYLRRKGFWSSWFSAYGFSHCDFVKFEKYRRNGYAHRGYGLPDPKLKHYYYSPTSWEPPISREEFKDVFQHVGRRQKPRWAVLPFHNTDDDELPTDTVSRIPQRLWNFDKYGNEREDFWGIYVCEQRSALMTGLHIMLCLAPFIGFCFLYFFGIITGDIQNATTPLALSLTLLGFFLSGMGKR
ncbi:hypothetical protein B0T10DRAFT_471124 [Thelonectria olida]|uniref:Protein kinase domain-containing protein n=1 Tax=Thelonectria olida TaxID=1576542 RepID=A0A9P9AU65_9HYPO|nr:hypothetical protein B0T10DRAFT_471124 [Thelonectria olida]